MSSVESPAGVVTLPCSLVQCPSFLGGDLGEFNKMLNTSDLDQACPLLWIHYGAITAYRIRRLYKIFIITSLIVKIVNNLNVNTGTGYYVELLPLKICLIQILNLKKENTSCSLKCLLKFSYLSDFTYVYMYDV